MTGPRGSRKAACFTESVIREMTRLADLHRAINLAQGFPNFPAPEWLKEAACQAIRNDINQYAITWGAPSLRRAVAAKYLSHYDLKVDPDREVTVACGSTECMIATLLALVDPGERVLVLEPFYENYGPDSIIAGASPVFVPLRADSDWGLDAGLLRKTISETSRKGGLKALILNSPHNPSGKVFTLEELTAIAELACRFDFYVITDEIYEHIVYDGLSHRLIAGLPGMWDRTVTISGLSKTFSVTGWRVGYIIAPEDLTASIRKVHDFLTVGAPAPLQAAGAVALGIDSEYYKELAEAYARRRDFFTGILKNKGFRLVDPSGAYYIMADITALTDMDDVSFVHHLIREAGVAAVPGSSFFHKRKDGRRFVRFAFCKTMQLLEEAAARIQSLSL